MKIGFDPDKDRKTRDRRGFGFPFAARIFLGDTIERQDLRFDYGEERIIATGMIGTETITVVYTWRWDPVEGHHRWIISARKANRKERRAHAAHFLDD